MNADLKRLRENAGDDAALSPSAKRRAISLSTAPIQDGNDDGTEDWMKVVETHRKEAIYRQMLEYRRMHEREYQRATELEAQKRVLEASVLAVEVCWTQLVNAVRDLAGKSTPTSEVEEDCDALLDPQFATAELEIALQKRLPTTKKLITRFVDMTSRDGFSPPVAELHSKCSKLQAESSAYRSNALSLQTQISTLKEQRDSLERDLKKTQKTLDRQRMDHDKAEQDWKSRDRDKGSTTPGPAKVANGSGHATPNGDVKDEKSLFESSGLLQDTSDLEAQSALRLKQLEALRAEHKNLRQEHDQLKATALHPSEAVLREAPWFQIYLHQLSSHYNRANDLQSRYEASESKLDELRSNNYEFRETIVTEARTETEALRQQITQKNSDLTRLRGQRDEMNAELLERRSREAEKMRFADEVEVLAKAREERILFLVSEVKRLKGALAAAQGSEMYLTFLRGDGGIDGDYVKDLETKMSNAQTRLDALTSGATEGTDIVSVRAELAMAKTALEKYERILGPNPEAAEDVRKLGEQLERAEQEKSRLKLQLQEAEEATNALYTEVEGLSKLWEGLEQTMKTKVYELKDGELRMSRLATEKAKANNKYFAAMQSKEMVENECKAMQRTVEKQSQLLQKAQEVERGLNAQIAAHEKGLTALKNSSLDLQNQLAQTTSDKSVLELKLSQTTSTLTEAQKVMHQRVADLSAEKAFKDKLQEENESLQRNVKSLKSRQEALAASGGSTSFADMEVKRERDKLFHLMKCRCCNQGLKQQVITRCMHTFCKDCLDQRIASRQRKCPSCGISFSKEEVVPIYWQ